MSERASLLWLVATTTLTLTCASPLIQGPSLASIELQQTQGRSHDLRQIPGQVVLLYLMTTGCDLCLADLTKLRFFHQRYSERGLRVVLVALDPDAHKLIEIFAQSLELPFPVVMSSQLASGRSALGTIPRVPRWILLDRSRKVRWDREGIVTFAELDPLVTSLLDMESKDPPP